MLIQFYNTPRLKLVPQINDRIAAKAEVVAELQSRAMIYSYQRTTYEDIKAIAMKQNKLI